MAMRWGNGSPERKIEAFIGAWGVKTGEIVDTDHLLDIASRIFEIDNSGLAARMADQITALGAKGRRAKAEKNIARVMGDSGRFSPDWGKEFKATQAATGSSQITEPGLHRMMDASQPHMIDGDGFEVVGDMDIDPAQLLRKVVSAVIGAGRADILWEFPEVLAFFGARISQREEAAHLHNVTPGMFAAADAWPNRKPSET